MGLWGHKVYLCCVSFHPYVSLAPVKGITKIIFMRLGTDIIPLEASYPIQF